VLAERDPVFVDLIRERLRKPIQPYLPAARDDLP
jgi:hypothetical protein